MDLLRFSLSRSGQDATTTEMTVLEMPLLVPGWGCRMEVTGLRGSIPLPRDGFVSFLLPEEHRWGPELHNEMRILDPGGSW